MGNSPSKDYYNILGVTRDADETALKTAYITLAMKYHSDRATGNKRHAEQQFREVSEAYDVLDDAEKRRVYDEFGVAGLRNRGMLSPGAGGMPGGLPGAMPGGMPGEFRSSGRSPEDIFAEFFGGEHPFGGDMFGGCRGGGSMFGTRISDESMFGRSMFGGGRSSSDESMFGGNMFGGGIRSMGGPGPMRGWP